MEEKHIIDYTGLKSLAWLQNLVIFIKIEKAIIIKIKNNLNITIDVLRNCVSGIPSWLTITVKHTLWKLYLIYKVAASWGSEWKS